MNSQEVINTALKQHQDGQFPQAEVLYRQVLQEQPNHPDALHLLGVLAYQAARGDEAVELITRAISFNPMVAEYHRNLGLAYAQLRRFDKAIECYRAATSLRQNYPKCYHNLAGAFQQLGRVEEALDACRRAVTLQNQYPEAFNSLGALLYAKGETAQAAAAYRKAISQQANYPQAYFNLGIALQQLGQLEAAIESYRKAVELRPAYAEAHTNLGVVLKMVGALDEAKKHYQRAYEIQPANTTAHSNLIYLLEFHPDFNSETIFNEQQEWERRHAAPLAAVIKPHNNDRNPDRRLKIGYVSPDLRHHVVGTNLMPLMREHDHNQFEIICYPSVEKQDSMSARLKSFADGWRDIYKATDREAAEMIRNDQIDILVDLTLHMADNRLLLFARKPAPVQVSYLGYCGGTGLKTIDYRISDPHMDPTDEMLKYYSEKTIRLPNTYWCYYRPDPAPPMQPLPALKNGFITFGCLNNFAKVSPATLDLWGQIMAAVPKSKLIIHCQPGAHQEAARQRIVAAGGSGDRVEFVGKQAFWQYLLTFNRIDIVLDPFPYGGGITTCDGFWMGAPAITLSGQTAVGRGGRSILSNIGLGEWVAYSKEDYVRLAAELAGDLNRLKELRLTMRERMLTSPMMDAKRFARDVEAAYRQMWRTWCATEPAAVSAAAV